MLGDRVAVELLIAEGLVITGAVADAEATVAGKPGEFNEPFAERILAEIFWDANDAAEQQDRLQLLAC